MNKYSNIGTYIVYLATNTINNKKYVGVTKQSLKARKRSHKHEAFSKKSHTYNSPFKRAIRKYGFKAFKWEVLESDLTKEEALEREKYFIEYYKTYYSYLNSNGYNATIGGEYIAKPKDTYSVYDPDSCDLVYVGDTQSTLKYCRIKSPSQLIECVKGKLNYCGGYVVFRTKEVCNLSEEELKHLIRSKINSIVQFDLYGNILDYFSTQQIASAKLHISQGLISSVISHKRVSCGGYVFMYYNDYIEKGFNKKQKGTKEVKIIAYNKEERYEFKSITQASKILGYSVSFISQCIKGIRQCENYTFIKK